MVGPRLSLVEARFTCLPSRPTLAAMERRWFLALGCTAAAALASSATAGQGTPPVRTASTADDTVRPPSWMRPLPPAEIDDTLAISGAEIEARKIRSRMSVPVRINGSGPYRFVVDSGADTSVIGSRIARDLALQAGEPAMLNTMTESRVIERALVDELAVGPTRIADLSMPVLEERHLGGEGMLGLDALVQQRLVMDFDKRLITVDDAGRPAARFDGEIVVTAKLDRGQLILTQTRASGLRVDAVIDTGSELTIGNLALRDKLVKRRGAQLKTIEITGVTGARATLQYATIPELRIGPVLLHNVPMAFADVPPFAVFGLADQPSLLIGTDLMENFRRISLDFRARKVRFQLRKCGNMSMRIGSEVTRMRADQPSSAACS